MPDYAALAAKYGGTVSTPQSGADYAALAAKHGGTVSQTQVQQPTSSMQARPNTLPNWFEDVGNDIKHGTTVTGPGKFLHAIGVQPTRTGEPGGSPANLIGNALVGATQVGHAITDPSSPFLLPGAKDYSTHKAVQNTNELIKGGMNIAAPAAAVAAPEAILPTVATYGPIGAGVTKVASKLGADPDTAELAGNAAMVGAPGIKESLPAVGKFVENNASGISKAAGYGGAAYEVATHPTYTNAALGILGAHPLAKATEAAIGSIGQGLQRIGKTSLLPHEIGGFRPSTPESSFNDLVKTTPQFLGAQNLAHHVGIDLDPNIIPPPNRSLGAGPIEMPAPPEEPAPLIRPAASQIVRGQGGRMTKQYLTGEAQPGAPTQYGAQPPALPILGESQTPPPLNPSTAVTDTSALANNGIQPPETKPLIQVPQASTESAPLTNDTKSPIINNEESNVSSPVEHPFDSLSEYNKQQELHDQAVNFLVKEKGIPYDSIEDLDIEFSEGPELANKDDILEMAKQNGFDPNLKATKDAMYEGYKAFNETPLDEETQARYGKILGGLQDEKELNRMMSLEPKDPDDLIDTHGFQQEMRDNLDRGQESADELSRQIFYKNNKPDVGKTTGSRYSPVLPGEGNNTDLLPWAQTPWGSNESATPLTHEQPVYPGDYSLIQPTKFYHASDADLTKVGKVYPHLPYGGLSEGDLHELGVNDEKANRLNGIYLSKNPDIRGFGDNLFGVTLPKRSRMRLDPDSEDESLSGKPDEHQLVRTDKPLSSKIFNFEGKTKSLDDEETPSSEKTQAKYEKILNGFQDKTKPLIETGQDYEPKEGESASLRKPSDKAPLINSDLSSKGSPQNWRQRYVETLKDTAQRSGYDNVNDYLKDTAQLWGYDSVDDYLATMERINKRLEDEKKSPKTESPKDPNLPWGDKFRDWRDDLLEKENLPYSTGMGEALDVAIRKAKDEGKEYDADYGHHFDAIFHGTKLANLPGILKDGMDKPFVSPDDYTAHRFAVLGPEKDLPEHFLKGYDPSNDSGVIIISKSPGLVQNMSEHTHDDGSGDEGIRLTLPIKPKDIDMDLSHILWNNGKVENLSSWTSRGRPNNPPLENSEGKYSFRVVHPPEDYGERKTDPITE